MAWGYQQRAKWPLGAPALLEKSRRLPWLFICVYLSCVSARRCPSAALSPEASLNQKRLDPFGFNSWSCRSCGQKKKRLIRTAFSVSVSPPFLFLPFSSLCPPLYNGGKWSKRLQGAVTAKPDMEEVYCSAIKQNKKQKYAVWRRALANSKGEQSRGPELGSVCVRTYMCSMCACAYTLIVQKPSGIQSPSHTMKIILLITMETLIKTKVCNYSRSAQDNGVSRRTIQHTDYWCKEWPLAQSNCCMSVSVTCGLLTSL